MEQQAHWQLGYSPSQENFFVYNDGQPVCYMTKTLFPAFIAWLRGGFLQEYFPGFLMNWDMMSETYILWGVVMPQQQMARALIGFSMPEWMAFADMMERDAQRLLNDLTQETEQPDGFDALDPTTWPSVTQA